MLLGSADDHDLPIGASAGDGDFLRRCAQQQDWLYLKPISVYLIFLLHVVVYIFVHMFP